MGKSKLFMSQSIKRDERRFEFTTFYNLPKFASFYVVKGITLRGIEKGRKKGLSVKD